MKMNKRRRNAYLLDYQRGNSIEKDKIAFGGLEQRTRFHEQISLFKKFHFKSSATILINSAESKENVAE
jgi:hypothetical protein